MVSIGFLRISRIHRKLRRKSYRFTARLISSFTLSTAIERGKLSSVYLILLVFFKLLSVEKLYEARMLQKVLKMR